MNPDMDHFLRREAASSSLKRRLWKVKQRISRKRSAAWPYAELHPEDGDLCDNPNVEEMKTYQCRITLGWPGPDPQPASAWHAMTALWMSAANGSALDVSIPGVERLNSTA